MEGAGLNWRLEPLPASGFVGARKAVPGFGIVVAEGCDLALLADEGKGVAELEALLVKHSVVVIRGQRLSERQEVDVARRFAHDEVFRPPSIEVLGNCARDGSRLSEFARPGALDSANPRGRPGEYWHVDGSQNAMPMIFATISAANLETARCGGSKTLFASGVTALDLLEPEMRRRAESLAVRYSKRLKPVNNTRAGGADRTVAGGADPAAVVRLRHHTQTAGFAYLTNPLVRVHPILGCRSLWVSPGDMENLEAIDDGAQRLSPEDSHALLKELLTPGTRDGWVYEHEYELGDYVIWDNRSAIHSTSAYDYEGGLRHLHHVSLKGPPAQQPDIPLRLGEVIADQADIRKVWWGEGGEGYAGANGEKGYGMSAGGTPMTFQRPDAWAEPPPSPPPPPARTRGVNVVDVGCLVRELGEPASPVGAGGLSGAALATVDALHKFCRAGSGGLILVNHGLEEAIGAAMAAACAFHAEPMDVKMSHAPARLYDPPNSVKIAVRPASLHERMSYPRVVFEEDSIGGATAADVVIDAQNDGIDRAPPTPIDGGSPDLFRVGGVDAAMRTYQRGIMRLSLALLRAMAIALGLPGDHFDGYWSLSNSGVTVLRYLPIASEAEKPLTDGYFGQIEAVADIEGAGKLLGKPEFAFDKIGDLQANMRVYPHADGDSWFTLLSHDNVDGLQVLLSTADDEWIDVEMVAPQQIVLQVGQILQRFTNDEYRATPHRVLRPEAPCPARTTLSFFFRPSIDMPLEVPQVLRRPNDAGGVYETITVREHMALGRVAADGSALKLTSNVLRDGRWVGVRTRS